MKRVPESSKDFLSKTCRIILTLLGKSSARCKLWDFCRLNHHQYQSSIIIIVVIIFNNFISEKITLFGLKQLRPLLRMTQSSDRKNLNWKMLASEVWWTFATDVKTWLHNWLNCTTQPVKTLWAYAFCSKLINAPSGPRALFTKSFQCDDFQL